MSNQNYVSDVGNDNVRFSYFYVGQSIEIRYVPEYPKIFKVMLGDMNIRQFKNNPNRNLTYRDMYHLSHLKNVDVQLEYLNTISYGWEKTVESDRMICVNKLKNEAIGILDDNSILCKVVLPNTFIPENLIRINKELPELDIENQPNNKSRRTLIETDSFEIIKVNNANIQGHVSYFVFEKIK